MRRLGPVVGDETTVPTDHRRWSRDQHDLAQSSAIECPREQGEHGAVGGSELRAIDLSLQDEDLVAKSEDLGITLVTGHEQESETSNQ